MILIIILNVNDINNLIKRQKLTDWIQSQYHQYIHFKHKNKYLTRKNEKWYIVQTLILRRWSGYINISQS